MPGSRVARRAFTVLPLLALTSIPSLAHAAEELVFDTWNGAVSSSIRPAGDSPGSQITIGAAVTISSIAVRADLNSDANLKFVIFTHPNHEVVHISEPEFFADEGMTWKQSSTLDVVLPPGTYDIGAIADVGGSWSFDSAGAVAGNYSSTATNPNFSTYGSPILGEHALADGAVRLYARIPECGDGFVDVTEECDDANADSTDDCLDTCVAASCGDGFTWSGNEDCDDANDTDDDDCTNACTSPVCGDGIVQVGEACDDGNSDNTDDCPDTCEDATCGDGYVGPGESCDDANMVDDDACSNACASATCGDGSVQLDEECDDGNRKAGDGCARDCTVEQEDGSGGRGGSGDGGSGDAGSGEPAGGEGGSGDGGSGEGGLDEGGLDEGGSGAIDDGGDDSGCSCSLKKRDGAQGAFWALLGLGVLAGARRRKR